MIQVKRFLAMLAGICLSAAVLIGCGSGGAGAADGAGEGGDYSIVCTIFPEYDWVRQVLGDRAERFELTMMLDNGTDLHSYQPTAADIAKVSSCDLFIYVGGESDEWVEDALKEAANKEMQVINLLDVLGNAAKEEEVVEGMEAEEEDEEGDEQEYDEHVWLSLRNASVFVEEIAKALISLDEEDAEVFRANCDAYKDQLSELDRAYQAAIPAGTSVVFGDRFPFRYLTDDYDIRYYAAFSGCSAETEASFETVVFLAGKVDELGLSAIFAIDGSDQGIAQTIVSNTKEKDQEILVLDSMQSVTLDDVMGGTTYLGIMKDDLEVLKKAI